MRLRSIRMKNGGATIRVLHNDMPNEIDGTPENWRGTLLDHARHIASQGEPGAQLDGFIVIGLFEDGKSSMGCRFPARLPACLIPGYINELLRRDVVVEREAIRVFDNKFEWVE